MHNLANKHLNNSNQNLKQIRFKLVLDKIQCQSDKLQNRIYNCEKCNI